MAPRVNLGARWR